MTAFQVGEIVRIGEALKARGRMVTICAAFEANHTRDEIVEAIDAIHRNDGAPAACLAVNKVLAMQAAGVPLINGRPAGLTYAAADSSYAATQKIF